VFSLLYISLPLADTRHCWLPANAHHCCLPADARLPLRLAPVDAPARLPTTGCRCYSPTVDARCYCSPAATRRCPLMLSTPAAPACPPPTLAVAAAARSPMPAHRCSPINTRPSLLSRRRLLLPMPLLARSKYMALLKIAMEERQNIHRRGEVYLFLPNKNAHRYCSQS
jgi:hypothetical protein